MKNLAYKDIKGPRGALATLTPFTHDHSMRGEWDEMETTYIVYSYSTVIAWVNVWHESWFNPQRYSVATSRQQSMVRSWLAFDTEASFGQSR